jgi:hypothetical protein
MRSRDRMTVAKDLAANIAVAGVLAVGAAVACSATAAADPPPPLPADPAVPDPSLAPPSALGTMGAILAPNALPAGPGGAPDFLLSQYPVPAVPGSQPAVPMSQNVLDSTQYLMPQNFRLPPTPDQGTLYGVGPGAGISTTINGMKGAHALWHGAMGKLTPDQLGEPLPGTAPPPGTAIPQGLVDFLPDPAPDLPPAPPPGG